MTLPREQFFPNAQMPLHDIRVQIGYMANVLVVIMAPYDIPVEFT